MMDLNLYELTLNVPLGYDTYDSAVVAAVSEDAASRMHPNGYNDAEDWGGSWVDSPEEVNVELIGKAVAGVVEGVVLASYNV